jgi:hypothetical protein
VAVDADRTIRFQGPPGELAAVVALPRQRSGREIFLRMDDVRIPLRVVGDQRTITALALSLPDVTSPGRIDAEVCYGAETYQAVLDVLPRARVRAQPSALTLRAGAVGVEASVDVMNRGNAAVELQREQTITVRQAGALARGIRGAFKGAEGDLPGRLIDLGERLAAEPAAELTVRCSSPTQSLEPGERAQVVLSAELPAGLDAATTWSGRVVIFDRVVPITLEHAGSAAVKQQES